MAGYYTYIMTNLHDTVLYVGVTNNLKRRVYEHKHKLNAQSFTARYNCDRLIWFERFDTPEAAIAREKQVKKYKRNKKEALIERDNGAWLDLYDML